MSQHTKVEWIRTRPRFEARSRTDCVSAGTGEGLHRNLFSLFFGPVDSL